MEPIQKPVVHYSMDIFSVMLNKRSTRVALKLPLPIALFDYWRS